MCSEQIIQNHPLLLSLFYQKGYENQLYIFEVNSLSVDQKNISILNTNSLFIDKYASKIK